VSKHGLAFEHLGFTPTSISSSAVLVGDRPFASCLMAKIFTVAQHPSKQNRIASTLSLGVIGPMAGGKEFQSAIHRWINDDKPLGWQHQIRNDLVLNVDVALDQSVYTGKHFMIAAKGICRAGTLNTKVELGSMLMAGWYENPWSITPGDPKKFRVYLYANPSVAVIGYDATLQGGIFNRHSSYTISASDISRIVFQNHAAIVFKINRIYLEYFQCFITKEFATGTIHHWGGIRIGVGL
jgi:lipid A 3-O-deacylase